MCFAICCCLPSLLLPSVCSTPSISCLLCLLLTLPGIRHTGAVPGEQRADGICARGPPVGAGARAAGHQHRGGGRLAAGHRHLVATRHRRPAHCAPCRPRLPFARLQVGASAQLHCTFNMFNALAGSFSCQADLRFTLLCLWPRTFLWCELTFAALTTGLSEVKRDVLAAQGEGPFPAVCGGAAARPGRRGEAGRRGGAAGGLSQ